MQTISTGELKELIDSKAKYVLIDVREKDELVFGMIPTARHIPLSEFQDALECSDFKQKYGFSLSKNDRLILYCKTGGRSKVACKIANDKGFTAENYKGSIWSWSQIDPSVSRY